MEYDSCNAPYSPKSQPTTSSSPLKGGVYLVAGASRGVGRGIAQGLAQAGATVIVTARSSESGAITDQRKETLESVARDIYANGGIAHPYLCDHTQEHNVDCLMFWILRRFKRLDAVISSVWDGNEGFDGETYRDGSRWATPFWDRPLRNKDTMFSNGPYAELILARAAAPYFIKQGSGTFVFVTYDTLNYIGDLYYDLAKAATNRLIFALDAELKPYLIPVIGFSPGYVETERVIDYGDLAQVTETPLACGETLACVLADPDRVELSGNVHTHHALAKRYARPEHSALPRAFEL